MYQSFSHRALYTVTLHSSQGCASQSFTPARPRSLTFSGAIECLKELDAACAWACGSRHVECARRGGEGRAPPMGNGASRRSSVEYNMLTCHVCIRVHVHVNMQPACTCTMQPSTCASSSSLSPSCARQVSYSSRSRGPKRRGSSCASVTGR